MLISCLACEVMHIARRAMAQATGTGWSLRRLRERVLRAGARLVISARTEVRQQIAENRIVRLLESVFFNELLP